MHRRSYHAKLAFTRQLAVLRYALVIFIISAITLPFHYLTSEGMIVLKNHWSIENTFVTRSDISEMVSDYSIANRIGKEEIMEQSWVTKLMYEDIDKVNVKPAL